MYCAVIYSFSDLHMYEGLFERVSSLERQRKNVFWHVNAEKGGLCACKREQVTGVKV